MRELEALLNKRWILKAEDKELYYNGQGWKDAHHTDKRVCKRGLPN